MSEKTATAATTPAPAAPSVAVQDAARTEPAGGRKRAGLGSVKPGEAFQVVDGNGRVVHAGEVDKDGSVVFTVKGYHELGAPFGFALADTRSLVADDHTVTVVD